MNKAGKRFVLYALASVFVMLVVLLGIINGINFTMASEDADRLSSAQLRHGDGFRAFRAGAGGMDPNDTPTGTARDTEEETGPERIHGTAAGAGIRSSGSEGGYGGAGGCGG